MLWSECKTLCEGFIHRKDLPLDGLQALALADINLILTVQENEGGATLTLADHGDGLWSAELPADYATMRAVDIDNWVCNPVDYKTLKQRGNERSWYAVSGMEIWTTRAGELDMLYTTRTLPGETNAILDRYPPIMLYGVLKHAAIYAQDYEAAAGFEKTFLDQCSLANAVYQNAAFGPGMAPIPMGGHI